MTRALFAIVPAEVVADRVRIVRIGQTERRLGFPPDHVDQTAFLCVRACVFVTSYSVSFFSSLSLLCLLFSLCGLVCDSFFLRYSQSVSHDSRVTHSQVTNERVTCEGRAV